MRTTVRPVRTVIAAAIVGVVALGVFGDATFHRWAGNKASSLQGLSAPVGYSNQQMIFDDQFSGSTLDTRKWTTHLGAEGMVWNNNGELPPPYSGPTLPGAGNEAAMFGPSQVNVDNGLTLTAQRNSNQYASAYPWISGVVTTEGKFSLPPTGWYVQVKAKMPDQSQGMWPAIWFLPGVPRTPFNEIDGYEGGFLGPGDPNTLMNSNYFADQGQQDQLTTLGFDMTAGYHVYGVRFIPGQSITAFVDGRQVYQLLASSTVTITSEPYQIMLELQVATQQTSGWHTVTTASTPSSTMTVAEVQAYS
jgi:beta-glucanase (GH16 family)